jgi:hypothetical protein
MEGGVEGVIRMVLGENAWRELHSGALGLWGKDGPDGL